MRSGSVSIPAPRTVASVGTDAYQLFAYGRRYGCRRVVLVYPRTTAFREPFIFRFLDDLDLEMACFPFNVADSAGTVNMMMRDLLR